MWENQSISPESESEIAPDDARSGRSSKRTKTPAGLISCSEHRAPIIAIHLLIPVSVSSARQPGTKCLRNSRDGGRTVPRDKVPWRCRDFHLASLDRASGVTVWLIMASSRSSASSSLAEEEPQSCHNQQNDKFETSQSRVPFLPCAQQVPIFEPNNLRKRF
ncbi:unnamed protein product, partial [Protopolystoma xenopodis]